MKKVKARQLRWTTIPENAVRDTIWSQQSQAHHSAQALSVNIVDSAQLKALFTETDLVKKQKADKRQRERASAKLASVIVSSCFC
jgi:hypothetical protein